jgi:hypothetical protein
MSLSLIRHLWACNRAAILKNSLLNCHAFGLHSICLLDAPGNRIRMFVAGLNHELWKNAERARGPLSVGYHPHHCDIEIEVVHGTIDNRVLNVYGWTKTWPGDSMSARSKYSLYEYRSKLRGEEPGFSRVYLRPRSSTNQTTLKAGESIRMRASVWHTVAVSSRAGAAWIVYEGAEDPDYKPLTLSDADLATMDFSGMYQPMTESQVECVIKNVLDGWAGGYDFNFGDKPAGPAAP